MEKAEERAERSERAMEDFIAPPEAPVFQPTREEFGDPIAYLTKIRPMVVNTGICKIRPPPVSNRHFTSFSELRCISSVAPTLFD